MSAVGAWAGSAARRQWPALVVLALLIGLSGAVVLTAIAGARRGSSAVERLLTDTRPATLAVLPNEPGFDWNRVRQLPEVVAVTEFAVNYLVSVEADGVPVENLNFPMVSPEFFDTIERPIVFEGRVPDAADEAFVTPSFESVYGLGVGDIVQVTLPTPEESAAGEYDAAAAHPHLDVTIVGVGEGPWLSELPGKTAGLSLAPALADKYRDNLVGGVANSGVFVNALVRLRDGAADIAAFEDGLQRVTGRSDIEFINLVEEAAVVQRTATFESRWLLAFAAAALGAALLLVGQAVVRLATANGHELRTGRALGFTSRQAATAGMAGPAAAGLVGAMLALTGAWIASRWMPIGTAGYFEPQPGTTADWVVLAPGPVVIAAIVATGAWWASRRTQAHRVAPRPGSFLGATIRRVGLTPPIELGVRSALESGHGRSRVPVAPALVGAAVGVLGVVAALSFSRGVDDVTGDPARFGQIADLTVFLGFNGVTFVGDDDAAADLLATVRGLPESAAASDVRTGTATAATTGVTAALWEYRTGPGEVAAVVLRGHLPETADELALGPNTLAALGADVGDEITLAGERGERVFGVSGEALIVAGPHNGYADGGYVTPDGFDRLFDGFKYRIVLIDVRSDLDVAEAVTAMDVQLAAVDPGLRGQLEPVAPPDQLAQLRQVRRLPLALGLFLAVLAVGAVGHSLATAVRRRSGDLAILRALGMTRRQTRLIVTTQASVLALVGLLVGVPLGLLVGFRVWRSIAGFTPFQYSSPWAVWSLVLMPPFALVIANFLAAWPARRAARLNVADALRAE